VNGGELQKETLTADVRVCWLPSTPHPPKTPDLHQSQEWFLAKEVDSHPSSPPRGDAPGKGKSAPDLNPGECSGQGWARDVKARDRDAHLPRPRRWLHQPRPRRDVKISRRDVCSDRNVKVEVLLTAKTCLNVIFYVHCF